MNHSWSLKELYNDFNECYESDFDNMICIIKDINLFCNTEFQDYDNVIFKVESYLKKLEQFTSIYSKLNMYAVFRISENVNDSLAVYYLNKLNTSISCMVESRVLFENFIKLYKDIDQAFEKSEYLKDYEFFIKQIISKSKYSLSNDKESIIYQFSIFASKAWAKIQSKISSDAIIKINESNKNINDIFKFSNIDIKKLKFKDEISIYEEHAFESAAALNSIKGEAIYLSNLRGYKSVLHKTLSDYQIDSEILEALIGSVADSLPDLRRYYKIKAKILGFENGLPYYEKTTPICPLNKSYTYDEAKVIILKSFRTFSERLYLFAKEAFDKEWVDYSIRPGKEAGATCDGVYAIKESRIRVHFNGDVGSINTLAHELGHGYHNLNLFDGKILNNTYTMPIAETSSKFCEIILKKELIKNSNVKEKIFYTDFILSSYIDTIIDIQSRFYFEYDFLKERKNAELTVNQINNLMIKAQMNTYGDAMDKDLLHPYMWLNKVHYYNVDRNYYNFPYSFGALLSLGMYKKYEDDKETFVKLYDKFLNSTGKMNVYDLCKLLDIDIKDKAFWKSSLNVIIDMINDLEAMVK